MICRACRSDRLDEVFSMDPMPLAGAFAATAEEARAMPRYPLTWLLCHDCGLVNVSPDIPDDELYRTYSYAASTVPALVRHHAEFAKVLTNRYTAPIRLLEIGGNDGVLLNQLPETWTLVNVDPSDVARNASVRSGWALVQPGQVHDFGPETFDVVTSSNAFAHFTDIAGALDGVARVLKPGGEFWIEVHDLWATLRTNQWDTIYHEHKVEWSLDALRLNAWRRGLRYVEHWNRPLHGGLLRVLFRKEPQSAHRPLGGPPQFHWIRKRYAERRKWTPPLMEHSAAYGAAGRAVVYLNQMDLPIDYIVDASPLRAGKFVPGVGIPVLTPEVFEADRPATTLITAWNHQADIRRQHPGYDGWVTAW
jgi:SAM-dependent methyltransferase